MILLQAALAAIPVFIFLVVCTTIFAGIVCKLIDWVLRRRGDEPLTFWQSLTVLLIHYLILGVYLFFIVTDPDFLKYS